jgi:hypothetical protein
MGRCKIASFATPTPSRKTVMIVAHVIQAKRDHESEPDSGIGLSFLQIVWGRETGRRAEDGGRRKEEQGGPLHDQVMFNTQEEQLHGLGCSDFGKST